MNNEPTYSERLLRGGKGLLAWQRLSRFRYACKSIEEFHPGSRCDVMIDIGAADGIAMPFLQPLAKKVIAVNYYVNHSREFLTAYPEEQCITADARALPFDSASSDIIVSFETLHLLPGQVAREQALRQIVRVLKPGGLFMCSVPIETGCSAIQKYITRFLTRNQLDGMTIKMALKHCLHPLYDIERYDCGRQVGFDAYRFAKAVAKVMDVLRLRPVPIPIIFPMNLVIVARRGGGTAEG